MNAKSRPDAEPEDEPRPALVIQQQPEAPPGLLGEWMERREIPRRLVRPAELSSRIDPGDFSFVVALGSEHAVYDCTQAWIRDELRFLERAVDREVPVLGICFGAQALASALGARVARALRPEVGWVRIESAKPELIAPGSWFSWHLDTFELPDGAELLAHNTHSLQAFGYGPHLALQFHAEVTPETIDLWLTKANTTVSNWGVEPQRVRGETRDHHPAARQAAMLLFDHWHQKLPATLREHQA